jgi:hypothetical protein
MQFMGSLIVAMMWRVCMVGHFGHFISSMTTMVDQEERIQALEERAVRRDRETAELFARFSRGAADFARQGRRR